MQPWSWRPENGNLVGTAAWLQNGLVAQGDTLYVPWSHVDIGGV